MSVGVADGYQPAPFLITYYWPIWSDHETQTLYHNRATIANRTPCRAAATAKCCNQAV